MSLKPKTYAVVDIETTGTNPKEDRIIQFGCVMIEAGKIISRFSIDVNPGKTISKQIQKLTGITNQRVQDAPYFEDVALTIYHLLAETIFVAHNVHFDYHFLNEELKRCGAPELKILGIDTVELAQIFFPTEPSFRLSDLAERFGFSHENPHQADSDAEVTGHLFLRIKEKIQQLPLVTVEQIARLSKLTSMDTGHFIWQILEEMKEKPAVLPENLEIIEGIALQKKKVELFFSNYYDKQTYPRKKQAKEKLFQGKLSYRKEQNRMMNAVYDHFTKAESKNLMIEAATGMGKTIGYLFPLSYLATPEEPAIISTVSLVLQSQIIEKDIPLLNRFLAQPIQAVILKSFRHYIDLQRYKATLQQEPTQKQYALYQMAVLVWLTQTKTGDLDELQLTNLNHAFFKDIYHRGLDFLSAKLPFYEQDFLRHLFRQVKQSNFLIVNHALLVQETLREKPLLPKSQYLLIDEAHHLPEIAEKINDQRLNLGQFRKQIDQLSEPDQLFDRLANYFKDDRLCLRYLSIYQEELYALNEAQFIIAKELNHLATMAADVSEDYLVTKDIIDTLSFESQTAIDHLQLFYQEISQLQEQMKQKLVNVQDSWTNQMRIDLAEIYQLFEQMTTQHFFMERWLENWQENYVHWFIPAINPQHAIFHLHDFYAAILPTTSWYDRYKHILYVGGTLKIGSKRYYLAKRLGIEPTSLKVITTPYDYEKQGRVYIPDNAPETNKISVDSYINYLTELLTELIHKERRPILVLFTSHEILQKVYQSMHLKMLQEGREIIAQGFGGSRERLLKRFILSADSILFGADSFWEGVDLPGDALQLVVVTRLPFENPARPLVKARYAFLEAEGMNPFYQEAVPKAALKLRQALGRLIRSEEDRGILIVLDQRLVTASYGKQMIRALPKNLPIEVLPPEKLFKNIHDFLTINEE